MRPANVVTSVADVLAGIAISGLILDPDNLLQAVLPLCLSTIGLYAGGIVFNDVFDADLDRIERPERAIPSGAVSLQQAVWLGSILLLCGILFASLYSSVSGWIAAVISIAALVYNRFSKHHVFFGPVNMGLCRGLNLLLGISAVPALLPEYYFLAAVPLVYIFSITMISQGEVHGGDRTKLYTGGFLYLLVIAFIAYYSAVQGQLLPALIFLVPFVFMIYRPLFRAISDPAGKNIGRAVKAGVISLILMDASWAAASGAIYPAVFITCLLPLSMWLAQRFAVT